MTADDIQQLCSAGQEQLSRTEYALAERTLAEAERLAWQRRDMLALSRLYMPLQEARRQKRQRSGEGCIRLDIVPRGPEERIDPLALVEQYPVGQLLVAGWGSLAPAIEIRRQAAQRLMYLEVFLGAAFPTTDGLVVVVAPLPATPLPDPSPRTPAELAAMLPPGCLLLGMRDLPVGQHRATAELYSLVMTMWERLHAPFLSAADAQDDPLRRIESYRLAIEVDSACELAHQRIACLAAELARRGAR